jgi:hypothetical protein
MCSASWSWACEEKDEWESDGISLAPTISSEHCTYTAVSRQLLGFALVSRNLVDECHWQGPLALSSFTPGLSSWSCGHVLSALYPPPALELLGSTL